MKKQAKIMIMLLASAMALNKEFKKIKAGK
jgi:hypothetical protein